MIVTATQIKITSITGLFRFISNVQSIEKQRLGHDGVTFIKFQGPRTLSGWSSLEEMKSFRNRGSHLGAMKNLKKLGVQRALRGNRKQSQPGKKQN
jgi:hypothetical protein